MELYHYTSASYLQQILSDGYLRLTRSNLKQARNPKIENGSFADVTDSFKPVVWFSNELNFENANDNGFLSEGVLDKTEVAIAILNANKAVFKKWDEWAKKNNIDKEWFRVMKKTAPNWRTFYISEMTIYLNEWDTRIVFRPDIAEKLTKEDDGSFFLHY